MHEIFARLIAQRGLSAYAVAKATGIGQDVFSRWKNGATRPSLENMRTIAEYLGVSIEYLLTGEEAGAEKPPAEESAMPPELAEVLDYYRNKPGMKLLFSVTKDATPEDIIKTAEMIEDFKRKREGEEK